MNRRQTDIDADSTESKLPTQLIDTPARFAKQCLERTRGFLDIAEAINDRLRKMHKKVASRIEQMLGLNGLSHRQRGVFHIMGLDQLELRMLENATTRRRRGRIPPFAACVDPLDSRLLLSASPVGDETLVNSTTAEKQERPDVEYDSSGNYVVVWSSKGQDGDTAKESNIYFQRYHASATPQGTETRVNTTITGNQNTPKVAVDADGDFVVVWEGNGTQAGEIDADGVFFQRFNSSGVAQGGETLVNTSTTGKQKNTSVVIDSDGDFVVVWEGAGDQTGEVDGEGVFFQRFDPSGVAQGSETLINSTTAKKQENPDIDMDSSSNFVVVWSSKGQDGDAANKTNIYFQQKGVST